VAHIGKNCSIAVAQHSILWSQVPRVMRHTNQLNAVLSHTLRCTLSSTLITASQIVCPRLPNIPPTDFHLWSYVKGKVSVPLLPQTLRKPRDRIRGAVMSVSGDILRGLWDETAFIWDMFHIAHGSHIEHLRAEAWMLGRCYGTIRYKSLNPSRAETGYICSL
jgi:hypothetical protein